MITQIRHHGFVLGSDLVGNRRTWKVRVKDEQSRYDGQKFVVASVHGDIELAQGLNVHFVVGTMDGSGDNTVLRAVDVRIVEREQPQHSVNRSN